MPAQVAIAWLIANPVVTSAIIGARTGAQLQETVKSLAVGLSEAEISRLSHVSNLLE
jgi:aryl-alcohol dehydrogenase-like predicted oxidoreductase